MCKCIYNHISIKAFLIKIKNQTTRKNNRLFLWHYFIACHDPFNSLQSLRIVAEIKLGYWACWFIWGGGRKWYKRCITSTFAGVSILFLKPTSPVVMGSVLWKGTDVVVIICVRVVAVLPKLWLIACWLSVRIGNEQCSYALLSAMKNYGNKCRLIIIMHCGATNMERCNRNTLW